MKYRYLLSSFLTLCVLAISANASWVLAQVGTEADPVGTPVGKEKINKSKKITSPQGNLIIKRKGVMPGQSQGNPKLWSKSGKKSEGKGIFTKRPNKKIREQKYETYEYEKDSGKKPRSKPDKLSISEYKSGRHRESERPTRTRPGKKSNAIPVGYIRISGGFDGGFWMGGVHRAEKDYSKTVFVLLDDGPEALKIKHSYLGINGSLQAQVLSYIYVGVRLQYLSVKQETNFDEEYEGVKGQVWRAGALQGTLTFRAKPSRNIQPYLEYAVGPGKARWFPFIVAKSLPPKETKTSLTGTGLLHGIAFGIDMYATPRLGAYMEARYSFGDFKMDSIVAPQFSGHLGFGAGLIFRL